MLPRAAGQLPRDAIAISNLIVIACTHCPTFIMLVELLYHLSPEDKHLVKTFIDAFLTKRHIQELAK